MFARGGKYPPLGEEIIQALQDRNLLDDIADLYALTKTDLLSLPFFKEQKADNILQAINDARLLPLDRLLYALGIRYIGAETAQALAGYFLNKLTWQERKKPQVVEDLPPSLFDFGDTKEPETEKYADLGEFLKIAQSLSLEDFKSIAGLGDKVAQSAFTYFQNPQTQHLFKKLANQDLGIAYQIAEIQTNRLASMTFVLTGTLANFTREELKDYLVRNGAKVANSVSPKITAVIAGDNTGSKLAEAHKLQVPVWGIKDIENLLND
ncbi:MAG TPA: hypothetical protein PLQ36_04315 [Candidatus Gracilibacteria bacterium]|nr:hypothetical protein [Candidatus Gracilibacteria bacterium]